MAKLTDYRAGLDPTDIAMIEILQDDGRISVSELGRKVGLSQPAASERLKRLEERGILTGYKAVVDPASLGLGMMAVIRLRTTHEHIKPCLKQFAEMPEIIEVLRLTGEDCFHLKVVVPSPAGLEAIVDSVARYGSVTTAIVLRSERPKPLGRALIAKLGVA
ncbi:AsnC family transcriptional regulator [Rhizobium sp. R634]|uniref:Lrp/AsnC family transcriptional regulator n=1 Tax=Rhizobium sp. R634 TaxID=1764274 RepID=UPI000B52F8CA|nr:Lrp/AsnC family transcriptional regulator [Rhizobium sp. R634]OWV77604.1 AsnC family transcriptional regulator [Rhizobium sp. R634]